MITRPILALSLSAALAVPGPALADPWKDESGHGRGKSERGERKEEFWDGNCKIERKWEKDGGYKEERKCEGGPPPRAYHGAREGYDRPPVRFEPPTGVYLGGLPEAIVASPSGVYLRCNREVIGGLLGGAAGGVLGNQVGQGRGNTAATVGGAVIGLLLGGAIGRSMDEADQACVGQTLEYAPEDRTVIWEDPDGGRRYEVTPTRTYENARGVPCREYETVVTIGGRLERATGTACRQPDGTWERVPS